MMGWKNNWCSLVLCITIASRLILHVHCASNHPSKSVPTSNNKGTGASAVKLTITKQQVILNNGIVTLTLNNPSGAIEDIGYNGIDKLLEPTNRKGRRGYWDTVWSRTGSAKNNLFDTLDATTFKVIGQDNDKIEVSFSKTWNQKTEPNGLPLNYDKRYIMLRGSSGFYSYGIFDHLAGFPALYLEEARIALKLNAKLFNYMAVSDDMQRIMPDEDDFVSGKQLDYKEAKILTNPQNPSLKGQVEDKYVYSIDNKDSFVHGWVSNRPQIGFWVITPSDEFRCGGPSKAELTSHAGPTALSIFFSGHYGGPDLGIDIADKEAWKKVYGPVFFYLNSDSKSADPRTLWNDAKRQMQEEQKKWPYAFPLSPDFSKANQRGKASGRLMVQDRFINVANVPAKEAYIGLALPGEDGAWQRDSKFFQFWTRTDGNGNFVINNIVPGTYNVYAWVPGVIGDYRYAQKVQINQGSNINLGMLVFNPPRSGPTIWDIGIPDRSAAEFYIPDPSPQYKNVLFGKTKEKWRQYGLWERYTDLFPNGDLVYTIGKSTYQKDWFFAQVNRRAGKQYVPSTWQVKFPLAAVNAKGMYMLRIALASKTYAQLEVRINDPNKVEPLFKTKSISSGRDNSIARHGIHGLYWLYEVELPGSVFVNGMNTLYLKLITSGGSQFYGVMYDYIRLEGPAQ